MPKLTEETAARLADVALGHVTREFPHKPDHVFDGPDDVYRARDLHPVFYGSFDWHSCVHSYWMLARLLRRFPTMAPAAAIRALFDRQLAPAKLRVELDYLRRPSAAGFERPYGWAWLLKLAAELKVFDTDWLIAIDPLAEAFVDRFRALLPKADYSVRAGTHFNSAFALALARDYAVASGDDAFLGLLWRKAVDWFGRDRDCQAWEPGGDEFLSPALIEAEAMRRLLPPEEWRLWFDGFLPGLAEGRPETLFRPVVVSDRADGKIAHLDGLNLSRAWCWRSLAEALPEGDPRRASMNAVASAHLATSLPHLAEAYMGEHWLATYAVLALDE